jgi:hypothetical protein
LGSRFAAKTVEANKNNTRKVKIPRLIAHTPFR